MLNLKKIALAAGVLAAFSLNAAAQIAPATSTHITTITVTAPTTTTSCTIGASGAGGPSLSNLTYVSGTTTAGMGYGSQVITCGGTTPTAFTVSANPGLNATTTRRAKSAAGDYMDYQMTIMTPTPATVIFDTATAPSFGGSPKTGSTAMSGAINQSFFSFNVNVPANQTVPAGSYTDTVTLTATF